MQIERIDHVQLAMPAGEEERAREFYSGLLGIPEVLKPPKLAARGGAWFEQGELRVHLGVDHDFRPAQKAHAAFRVTGLEELVAILSEAGVATIADDQLPGVFRVYVDDPFGNRLELMDPRE